MLVFEEGGKLENLEKNPGSKGENQQETQSTYDAGSGNQTQDTLVVGECSHHCATPAPLGREEGRMVCNRMLLFGACSNEDVILEALSYAIIFFILFDCLWSVHKSM